MSTPSMIPSGPFAIGDDRTARHARRQEIPTMHEPAGPDPIPAHVHDEPAVRRRVGADAYRAQGPDSIAAALHQAVQLEIGRHRVAIRAAMIRALGQVTTDAALVERIVDRELAIEIAAGRL